MIPIFGDAPSTETTPTRIGSVILRASVSRYEIEYVSIVPVSFTYTHSSVGRKHSSQNILGGKRMRPQFLHSLAMRRPCWSSARNRLIASPADHANFASGRYRTVVTLPLSRSFDPSSTPGHRVTLAVTSPSQPRCRT